MKKNINIFQKTSRHFVLISENIWLRFKEFTKNYLAPNVKKSAFRY